MLRDQATLLDIEKAAKQILTFKQGLDFESFLEDAKTQSAILHQLMIIGEAVKRVSDGFRNQHTEIPWRLIAGMRDKLIHVYDDVDLNEVWKTAEKDMPDLLAKLKPFLPSDTSTSDN